MSSPPPICAACGRAIGALEARVCVGEVRGGAQAPPPARQYHLDCWRTAATVGSAGASPKQSAAGAIAAQRA